MRDESDPYSRRRSGATIPRVRPGSARATERHEPPSSGGQRSDKGVEKRKGYWQRISGRSDGCTAQDGSSWGHAVQMAGRAHLIFEGERPGRGRDGTESWAGYPQRGKATLPFRAPLRDIFPPPRELFLLYHHQTLPRSLSTLLLPRPHLSILDIN